MGIFPLNAAANAFGLLPVGLQLPRRVDPHDEVLTCATEIRKSLEQLKDPRVIDDMAADYARGHAQSAWNRKGQAPSKEGCLVMNITRR